MNNGKDSKAGCDIVFDALCVKCDMYTLFFAHVDHDTLLTERCETCGSPFIVTNIMGIDVGREYYGVLSEFQSKEV